MQAFPGISGKDFHNIIDILSQYGKTKISSVALCIWERIHSLYMFYVILSAESIRCGNLSETNV